MLKKTVSLNKMLVIGTIVLFLGVGVQPAIATVNTKEKIIFDNSKDYLFQTIIDIANNPDVINLLEQYDNDFVDVDIERSVYRKILFRNPLLFFNLLITKPTNTHRYLNKCYRMGNEITNILREDKTLDIIESVVVNDKDIYFELDEIIKKDEKLSVKLDNLKEINKEIYPVSQTLDSPLLHIYIIIILLILFIILSALGVINFFTDDKFIVFVIIEMLLWNIYWEYFHDLLE
ncbi:hypothetical protein AYK20_08770 [Thermoplasmatales archaeon SG8-52-1]|jgi:hypothetical protein|nr:MAG: hypothetical protein AYK20_08770 [Thermoplasmatales archaeon SG8-52-1]